MMNFIAADTVRRTWASTGFYMVALAMMMFLTPTLCAAEAALATVSAPKTLLVTKVDGKGVAKVRRARGTIKVLALGDRLEEGDRVLTDSGAMVEALLGDGSLVRIAPNSDYEFKSFGHNASAGVFTWAFGLAKGGVRAIVEKKDNKKHVVKFKVNTPAGTMGVRGTELMLLHDNKTGTTSLYTFSGEVLLGAANANVNNTKLFQFVGKDYMSTVRVGDKMASTPRRFTIDEVLEVAVAGAKANKNKGDEGAGAASQGTVAALVLGTNSLAARDLGDKSQLTDAELARLKAEVALTTNKMREVQNYLSDYQGLQNEKVAAVAEGLALEGRGPMMKEGARSKIVTKGSNSGAAENESATAKQTTDDSERASRANPKNTSSKTSDNAAKQGRLSPEEANKIVDDRIAAHVKTLEERRSSVLSGGPISSDTEKLREDMAASEGAGDTATQAASQPLCSFREVCSGFWFFKSCHTEKTCQDPPPMPDPKKYPAAADTVADINQAINTKAAPPARPDDYTKPVAGLQNTTTQTTNDQKNKTGCCKLWLPCSELKGEQCVGRGHVVEVCDQRCKPTISR